MKTPSLEEVKEYFKNAKEVRCANSTEVAEITFEKLEVTKNGSIVQDTFGENWLVLYYAPKNKYAEIISYKEKTYELSERQKNELIKEPNIKDFFIREGIIDETIEIKKSLILNTPNDLELVQLIRKMF